MTTQLIHRNSESFWFSPAALLRASDCRELGVLPLSKMHIQPIFNLGKSTNNVTPF